MNKRALPLLTFALGAIVGGGIVANAPERAEAQTEQPMVHGIGGVFFKADNPSELRAWYERHLGIDREQQGVNFFWRQPDDETRFGLTVWSVFPRQSEYFGPGGQQFMINYRVDDLDALLERLRAQGVPPVGEVEEYWYGRFAWIVDGEGNRVELWEPVDLPPRRVRTTRAPGLSAAARHAVTDFPDHTNGARMAVQPVTD